MGGHTRCCAALERGDGGRACVGQAHTPCISTTHIDHTGSSSMHGSNNLCVHAYGGCSSVPSDTTALPRGQGRQPPLPPPFPPSRSHTRWGWTCLHRSGRQRCKLGRHGRRSRQLLEVGDVRHAVHKHLRRGGRPAAARATTRVRVCVREAEAGHRLCAGGLPRSYDGGGRAVGSWEQGREGRGASSQA